MRVFSDISEVFKSEDKAVIIEDDIVIDESFSLFCKSMLDRYENDERMGLISSMNHLGVYKNAPTIISSPLRVEQFGDGLHGSAYGWILTGALNARLFSFNYSRSDEK